MLSPQTLKNRKYLEHELRFEPLTHAMACGEARSLFIAIGRNGETVDSIRELIRVDQERRNALMDFAAAQPAESVWVLRTLEFRDMVLEKFERLVSRRRA
jgi:hypothetical protein